MEEKKQTNNELLRDLNMSNEKSFPYRKLLMLVVIVILFGIGTGFALSQLGVGQKAGNVTVTSNSDVKKGTVIGSDDTTTFKDTAEGMLEEGGIDGEGQFHLVRPGGESQNVYLTSSVVDLSQFIGKKIKVWGQTQKASKAGWLMDVGRVEVLQ